MIARYLACLLMLVVLSVKAYGQIGDTPGIPDTNQTVRPDTAFENDMGYDRSDTSEDYVEPPAPTSFVSRSGVYGGPTVEFNTLDPTKLDPDLSGDMVIYGGQGFISINGWVLGGAAFGATLYDISPKYDEFAFSYGGFMTGYGFYIVKPLSLQMDLLIGGGGIKMVKNRPDLSLTTGKTIQELYRDEGFMVLRPGISLGYAPLPFFDFRVGANYIYPVGGERVSDLKNLAFGLQLMIGFGG